MPIRSSIKESLDHVEKSESQKYQKYREVRNNEAKQLEEKADSIVVNFSEYFSKTASNLDTVIKEAIINKGAHVAKASKDSIVSSVSLPIKFEKATTMVDDYAHESRFFDIGDSNDPANPYDAEYLATVYKRGVNYLVKKMKLTEGFNKIKSSCNKENIAVDIMQTYKEKPDLILKFDL